MVDGKNVNAITMIPSDLRCIYEGWLKKTSIVIICVELKLPFNPIFIMGCDLFTVGYSFWSGYCFCHTKLKLSKWQTRERENEVEILKQECVLF